MKKYLELAAAIVALGALSTTAQANGGPHSGGFHSGGHFGGNFGHFDHHHFDFHSAFYFGLPLYGAAYYGSPYYYGGYGYGAPYYGGYGYGYGAPYYGSGYYRGVYQGQPVQQRRQSIEAAVQSALAGEGDWGKKSLRNPRLPAPEWLAGYRPH